MTVQLTCPAKINLFLAVGPRDRRDYHPLRTIFQAISICDELTIEPAEITSIRCDWAALPAENTLTKALRLMSEFVQLPPVRIELRKFIPCQSGLGGGSSNAAALLRGLNRLLASPLKARELMDVAISVGADVPFFLVGGRACGESYGEQLSPLPDPPEQWLVVAQPETKTSTREAYEKLDRATFEWRDWPVEGELYNDFERVAPCECLELIERLQVLGASRAGLTGSGSAAFGFFDSEGSAEVAAAQLREEGYPFASAARTLTRAESMRCDIVG